MRPVPSSDTQNLGIQAARITDAYSTSSRNRERLPIDLLKLRVRTFECELEQERQRHLTTGQSMPPEWSASLERERLILLDQIRQSETNLLRSSSLSHDSTGVSTASSAIAIRTPTPRLPHSAPASISVHEEKSTVDGETVIYAPTPRFPQSAPATISAYEGAERGRSSAPYSVHGRAVSRPRAATTRPFPVVPSLPPDNRAGSAVLSTSKKAKWDNRSQVFIHRERLGSPSVSKAVRSSIALSRPPSRPRSRPFLLPPIKVADVQATFANGLGEHSESPERRHFRNDCPFMPSPPASPSPISDAERAISPMQDYASSLSRPATHTPLSPLNLPVNDSGRRSARGWYPAAPRPEAKDTLRHFVLSPTRLRLTGTQRERSYDEKVFKVFTEDEDENVLPVHEIPDRVTIIADTSRFDTRSPSIVPPRPPGTQFNVDSSLTKKDNPTFLQPDVSIPMPLLDLTSPDLDNYVVSSASAYDSPTVKSHNTDSGVMAFKISNICTYLVGVFRDLTKYKRFLSYRNEDAQRLLNFLQTLLDSSMLEERFRRILLVALLRLSRKSELFPQCFALTDVTREGEYPVSDGHFGEIYRGCFRGRVVCVKAVKMYETSDQALLYKAFSREAVIWGQLSHTNVLPFYGIYRLGDTRNRIGLVSPWMQNGNVNDFLKNNLDIDRRLLISDVVAGMLYLHENGVVHGDLKCANILVTDSKRACLADFGLSAVTDAHGLKNRELSSHYAEGGTIRFQAPELIDPILESPRSEASDVYAFALVCYEIFTGNRPFPEVKNDYMVMVKVAQGERPTRPLGQVYLDYGLTDLMWRLMEDCWKQAPKNRPNAYQIAERIPQGLGADRRCYGGWGDLSPSRFRASDGCGDGHDVSGTLRVLETTDIFSFRFF